MIYYIRFTLIRYPEITNICSPNLESKEGYSYHLNHQDQKGKSLTYVSSIVNIKVSISQVIRSAFACSSMYTNELESDQLTG